MRRRARGWDLEGKTWIASTLCSFAGREILLAYSDLDDPRFIYPSYPDVLEDSVIDFALFRLLNHDFLPTIEQSPKW